MTITSPSQPDQELLQLWYTRCPVPTASGLAYNLGWLTSALGSDGLEVGILQDGPPELARHHFDHQLVGLFREGGNVPALAARAEGAPSRLIGLTWIDEWQKILVRPDSSIRSAADLAGARVALPAWAGTRGASFPRAMALHGFKHALSLGGLSLGDVRFVEIPTNTVPGARWGGDRSSSLFGIDHLLAGEVDAVYVKGASSAEAALKAGLVVAVDLDALPDRRLRVNNGTPRPLTVHQRILDEHPDLVVKFLAETLRAADWAVDNLDGVRKILQEETFSGPEGVVAAYGDEFHRSLHPNLSAERLDLFAQQKDFLLVHGFLAADFDLDTWVDHEPLRAAQAQLLVDGPALMTVEFLYTLPTQGDGRAADPARRSRGGWQPAHRANFATTVTDEREVFNAFDYLTQIARATELAGWNGITIPYDPAGEESWIVASVLAREAPRLRIVPEFQPGFGTAVYAAKLALSFQRFFADRLGWKLALANDPAVQRSVGDHVAGADVIKRAEEFLTVTRGVWHDSPFTFEGEFFEVEAGGFFDPSPNAAVLGGQNIVRRPFPTVYLDGTSDAELELSAKFADVHLFDAARPEELSAAIEQLRSRAQAHGRQLRFGLRLGIVARDSFAEAWRKVERLSSEVVATEVGGVDTRRSDDSLWHGFSDIGFAAPSGVVGTFDEVAQQLNRYVNLGISTFVLDAVPHLEEAYRLGEYLIPLVRTASELATV